MTKVNREDTDYTGFPGLTNSLLNSWDDSQESSWRDFLFNKVKFLLDRFFFFQLKNPAKIIKIQMSTLVFFPLITLLNG